MCTRTDWIKKSIPLIFLLAPFVLQAQETCDLSKCIQTGLENNFSLQVARNREAADVNNFNRGNAGTLPTVSLSGRYGGTLQSTRQNLRDGGTNNYDNIHNQTGTAGIDVAMGLFDGFRVQHTYRKLEKQAGLGGLNTRSSIENLVSGIVAEYNNIIRQQTLYSNMAYTVSLSRERVRIDEQRYLLGGASKMELLQSLVYFNADSSKYTRQAEEVRAAQIRLNQMLALDNPGTGLQLADSLITINSSLIYEDLLASMLKNNTILLIAGQNRQITELDYKIITSRSYPYLNLNAGYGFTHNAYGIGDAGSQQVRGLNYGLSLGLTLYDGLNRQREKHNARLEIKNRELIYSETEQELRADLLTLYNAYENNLKLLRLEEQNLAVARENLDIALERYKLGSLAGLELREVQKSLLDAEERLISVKYLAKLAEISLLQISGRIMEYL